MKLDYRALRPDGTTISQLRGLIASEEYTIADLHNRLRLCRENQNDYIARLSQDERTQLVEDNKETFPRGLPSIHDVPYVYDPAFKPFPSASSSAAEEMIGAYVRTNLDDVLTTVAPEAPEDERNAIRQALLSQANRMDPEGTE